MDVPFRRAIEREHLHAPLHVRRFAAECVEHVALGPPQVAAPDQPVALRAVRDVRQRARVVPAREVHQARAVQGHVPNYGPRLLRHRKSDTVALLHRHLHVAHLVRRVLPYLHALLAHEDLERADRKVRIGVELEVEAQRAVRRRRLAPPAVGFRLLQLAWQETSRDDPPSIVVREARKLARPHADVPQAREPVVRTTERTAPGLGGEHVRVDDLKRTERNLAGRVQLHAHIALLTLDERRHVEAGPSDGIDLVPVDVAGEDGDIEVRPEITRAGLAREAPLLA